MYQILFYILGTVAVVSALSMVVQSNSMMSAISLVIFMLSISGLFALLSAPFLAVVWVMAMAGAVMVLMAFVINMVDSPRDGRRKRVIRFGRVIGAIFASYMAIVFAIAILRPPFLRAPLTGEAFESASTLGRVLFSKYVATFELSAVLLLAAAVAAAVLLKRKGTI